MKKALKITALVLGILIFLIGGTFLFFTITAYNPKGELVLQQILSPQNRDAGTVTGTNRQTPGDLSILSWNLGYGGLDKYTDFFMDGGKMSLPRSQQAVETAIEKIGEFIASREADFYFIQEIDQASFRTKKQNQIEIMGEVLPEYYGWFGQNYKALFVPLPFSKPMRSMDSGILTLSRYYAEGVTRIQLPGRFPWPVWVFNLRRCAVITRIPSPMPEKDWCLINIHLDAYDNGTLRKQQLDFLRTTINELYKQGHYVVVGGDWNSLFPGITKDSFGPYATTEKDLFWVQNIPEGWSLPDWVWCYDKNIPTCRSLERPYAYGQNFTTSIDGFYVSDRKSVV